MDWSMRLIPTNKVSTVNAETMSALVKLSGRLTNLRQMLSVSAWTIDVLPQTMLRRCQLW